MPAGRSGASKLGVGATMRTGCPRSHGTDAGYAFKLLKIKKIAHRRSALARLWETHADKDVRAPAPLHIHG
jgi:hypothetical protein